MVLPALWMRNSRKTRIADASATHLEGARIGSRTVMDEHEQEALIIEAASNMIASGTGDEDLLAFIDGWFGPGARPSEHTCITLPMSPEARKQESSRRNLTPLKPLTPLPARMTPPSASEKRARTDEKKGCQHSASEYRMWELAATKRHTVKRRTALWSFA